MNPGLHSKSFWKLHMLKEEVSKLNNQNKYIPFISVSESWLKPFISNEQILIANYNIFRADWKCSKNGGALLYIHKDITIDFESSFDDDVCNAIMCVSKTSRCVICCIYRPPSSPEQSFSNLLSHVSDFIEQYNASDKFSNFIYGDFNFPDISWNNLSSVNFPRTKITSLFNFTDKFSLTQYISENTRKHNLLDLFFTENPNFVDLIQVEDVEYSDHRLVKVYNSFFSPSC